MPGALEGRGAIKEFSVFQAVTLATSGGSIPDASCHLQETMFVLRNHVWYLVKYCIV